MFFCLWEWTAATSRFEAPLVVLQDGTGNCPIQRKKQQRRLSELLSICWVHGKADFWNAMRTHSDLLTTSSPSEGKVRSIGGKCSRWRMRASCVSDNVCFGFDGVFRLTDFRNLSVWSCYMWWSWNLIQVHPIWLNLCKPNKKQNMGSLQKPDFSKKLVFLTGSYWAYNCFWSLKLLVYIYIHRKIQLYTIRYNPK